MGQKDVLTDSTRFFYTIINIKGPYFFCVSFKMEGDAAALVHFLLPLNKKFLFQSHLLFREEIEYFPVSGSMDSFVCQLTEIPALSF